MNPVVASEELNTTQVCVELSEAIPSSPVTLMLDPAPGSAPGSASGELHAKNREIHDMQIIVFATVADFGDITMSLTFPAFSAIGRVECANFNITDDMIEEPVESFTVTGSGENFMGQTQVNIQDNDGKG